MKDKAVFNQHRILRTITLVVASLAIGEYTGAAEKDDRPNVLFIAIDDMNDWAG